MVITKEECPDLYEIIQKSTEIRLAWLTDAVRAGLLCELLPEEMKKLKVTSVDSRGEGLAITVQAKEDTVKLLKTLGIQGLQPRVSSYSRKLFWTAGEGKLSNGAPFYIHVSGIEEPEGCVVEEQTRTSKEFVLVCPQTGEEIK
jgi:hypothetical protein